MDKRNMKTYIFRSARFLLLLFLILIVYITYLQAINGDQLAANPLNHRGVDGQTQVLRGNILDANNRKIAYSQKNGEDSERIYPYGAVLEPVSGYMGKTIGNAGIEGSANADLSGQNNFWHKFGPIAQLFAADSGNQVKLTVDAEVQKAAYKALGNRRGAVVVLDATTGAVLAMVSRPAFDPNTVEKDWEALRQQEGSPLLNRGAQGLYPPGSTFKVLIADVALKEKAVTQTDTFSCPGYLKVGSYTMYESHNEVHGQVDLKEALTVSCNTTFGTLALRLGADKLQSGFERFGFTKELNNEIEEAPLHLPAFKQLNDGEISQIGIGQGSLLVTPLRMAMLAAAFANHGVIMKPYLIQEVLSPGGFTIKKITPSKWLEATTPEQAGLILSYMRNVVKAGTGRSAAVSGIEVAGKTGTAENSGGEDHAWFIGSAPLPKHNIAFAVIVENSGGGGVEAAPIARQIIMNILDTEGVAP
ncbi:MAG: peptidoglycan D,D-transpeptidase FtsI family protein [Selenomonadaceae bacterium]|jgi:peptidoglycan glycosyltransferase